MSPRHSMPGLVACASLIALSFAIPPVELSAAPLLYGDYVGTHVTYLGVTEASNPGDPSPLFGPPLVTGNSIDFNPVGFDAGSAGAGSDITGANLSFRVLAKPGSRIDSISLSEIGDTTLAGNVAAGSMDTASTVSATGVLDIHEVDFVGSNHISVPFSLNLAPSGGTYFLGTDGGGGPVFHTSWAGSVTLDVKSILVANGFLSSQGATRISINLDNTLAAVSQSGTSALIAKHDFGAFVTRGVVENDIPEPSVLASLAIGAAALMCRRVQRSRVRDVVG